MPDATRPRQVNGGPGYQAVQDELARSDRTAAQKRRAIRAIRADRHKRAFDALAAAERSWSSGQWTIAVSGVEYDADNDVLVVRNCSATRAGVPILLDLPLIYVNPPLLVFRGTQNIGGVDTDVYEEDLRAALRDMVLETIRTTGTRQ